MSNLVSIGRCFRIERILIIVFLILFFGLITSSCASYLLIEQGQEEHYTSGSGDVEILASDDVAVDDAVSYDEEIYDGFFARKGDVLFYEREGDGFNKGVEGGGIKDILVRLPDVEAVYEVLELLQGWWNSDLTSYGSKHCVAFYVERGVWAMALSEWYIDDPYGYAITGISKHEYMDAAVYVWFSHDYAFVLDLTEIENGVLLTYSKTLRFPEYYYFAGNSMSEAMP